MRRIILSILLVLVTLCAGLLISGVAKKIHKHKQLTEKIAKLPSFSFMTLADKTFSSSEIKEGPVLVIRFHPECEHCRYEISEILKSAIPSSGTLIVMVSSANPDSIRKYFSQFDLSDYPEIITLADTSYVFGDIFGSDIIPSNYIYNKELNLVKILHGEVKTETILKYLNPGE